MFHDVAVRAHGFIGLSLFINLLNLMRSNCSDKGLHGVFLGVSDWLQPHWGGFFYPEDMPPEWRLAYYNTRFSCVWLPHAVWSRWAPATVEDWLGDTREEFRFLLEAGETITAEEQAVLAVLAPRLGGYFQADAPDLCWFDSSVDLRALSDVIQARTKAEGETYLLSRDGDIATLDKVGTLLALLGVGPWGRVG